jgi:hypothetical protein
MEALIKRPGVVVAHEARFGALYEALEPGWLENPTWTREKLFEMYGARIPASDLRRAPEDPVIQTQFGIYMSQEVQAHAEKLLVHSRYAADVLRMDRPPGAPGAETLVVGRGIPEPAIQRNGRSPSGGPTVLSHGAGERPEAIDLLMHAFADLAREREGRGSCCSGAWSRERGAPRRDGGEPRTQRRVHLVGRLDGDDTGALWRARTLRWSSGPARTARRLPRSATASPRVSRPWSRRSAG